MSIWYKANTLQEVQLRGKGTMIEHLGIQITELGTDFLRGTLPVDHRTIQPIGILHGGASIALAETLGSLAANLVLDPAKYYAVGLDINGNHLRAVKAGNLVVGTATALHLGRTTQVWSIRIENEARELICISRLTMAVLSKKD